MAGIECTTSHSSAESEAAGGSAEPLCLSWIRSAPAYVKLVPSADRNRVEHLVGLYRHAMRVQPAWLDAAKREADAVGCVSGEVGTEHAARVPVRRREKA